MSDELIQQKLSLCEETLAALEKIFPPSYEGLFTDPLTLPAIERYFQLLIDSAVDCNDLLLEKAGVERAETYFGTFTALRDHKLLDASIADKLAPSVGLRNALVHRYEGIDRKRMYESIKKYLPLYRAYLVEILKHVA